MLSIYKISSEENNLIQNAEETYKAHFKHALESVKFAWEFIREINPEVWVFQSFFSAGCNSIYLAFISVLRQHTIQAEMNIRQALEAFVLACYALEFTNENNYVYKDENGFVREKSKVKGKAYKWLENKYPYHNKKVRYFKDRVNELFAHPSLITTFYNSSMEDEYFRTSYFDNDTEIMIKLRLWMIANISLGTVDLIELVLKDYPKAKYCFGYNEKKEALWNSDNKIKEIIKKDPEFPSVQIG
jgi:hypothetical protein